ncbi:hypothetical protein C1646_773131 [Rhizophagus diaphanus]|nr:hypothetical protein C1646_773131 [Rhizophagus diaphanus] [Rhizophagus sp. MUCL 43196]
MEDSDEEECSIKTIDNSSDDLTLEVGNNHRSKCEKSGVNQSPIGHQSGS